MPPADGSPASPPHTVVRSNVEFDQGTITWEAKLGEQGTRVQLLLPVEAGAVNAEESTTSESSSADLSARLNVPGAPYDFAVFRNSRWGTSRRQRSRYTSGQIMEDVIRSIRSAALIVADVTPDNANVFYEVGFAHAIGKPTVLLGDRKRERLPLIFLGFAPFPRQHYRRKGG